MNAARPPPHFLLGHPAHFLALGFGSGLAPFAPGTFGTLVAVAIAAVLRVYANDATFLAVIAVLFVAGAWAADVTARHLGVVDHGSIVVDEIAAFLLVLYFVGGDPLREAIAFALFRLFDIAKPPPIRQVDTTWKNGAGAMLDDVIAAGYTLLLMAVGERLFG